MHTIARDGVAVNTDGNGNAVTDVSVASDKRTINISKNSSFASCYNSLNCVQYASEAEALKVSTQVGSVTNGIYIDANGKPQAMTYTLEKDIPSDMKIICTICSPLSFSTGELSVSCLKSSDYATSTNRTSDTKLVTAGYVNAAVNGAAGMLNGVNIYYCETVDWDVKPADIPSTPAVVYHKCVHYPSNFQDTTKRNQTCLEKGVCYYF